MKKILLSIVVLVAGVLSCGKNPEPLTPQEEELGEITVKGIIYDETASPMPGVVVSDGFKCVRTGADGKFNLDSDLSKVKFVYVVQPSGYTVPTNAGKPQFFKRLGEGDAQKINGVYQLRFSLNKVRDNPDSFTMILAGDPQPRSMGAGYDKFAYHSLDCCDDMWKDMAEYTSSISGRRVIGMMLGDLVHENMSLYENYVSGLSSLGYPTYSVIGNHDNNPSASDDDSGAEKFEEYLGPRNYAFNAGRFHVIVLDNLIMKPNSSGQLKDYDQGLTDEIWAWLQSDLKYVDYSTPLIVCSHSPMFMLSSGSDRSQSVSTRHGADYALLLSKYRKVYAWAGHVHNTFNYAHDASSKFPSVEVHTVSRVTGTLWLNEWLCDDGTPRGYVVAQADGDNLTWKFKPIAWQTGAAAGGTPGYSLRDFSFNDQGMAVRDGRRLDENYQLRAYPKGTYGDNYVYANVFMYDEKWGQVKFTSTRTGTSSVMTKVSDKAKKYDAAYREVFDYYKTNVATLAADSSFSLLDKDGNPVTPVPHLFRCYAAADSDEGLITVTDRFGNEYSTTVSW